MSNDLDAARIAATYSSALTAVDQAICSLYKAVVAELETPPAQFNSVRAKRWEKADDANLLHTIGRAREECQSSGIPFVMYDPILNEAADIFTQLKYFQTVPCPPPVDLQTAAATEEPIELPFGYGSAVSEYEARCDALSLLQQRMNAIISRLCEFRSSSVGCAVPEACLPTPAQAKERFAVEVERTARRLEHDPELLFSDWDYNAGLNACELNRLSAALQKGRLIEKTTEPTRTLLTFRHPDAAHEPIVWTVYAETEYITGRIKDGENAKNRLPKFADTLEYLRAWVSTACSDAESELESHAVPPHPPSAPPTSPVPPTDGPTIEGCFRHQGQEESGIGRTQWKLLKAVWGAAEGIDIQDAHRAVYGRHAVNRDKIRSLWNGLNSTLMRLRLPYAVEVTAKGGQKLKIVAVTALPEAERR